MLNITTKTQPTRTPKAVKLWLLVWLCDPIIMYHYVCNHYEYTNNNIIKHTT